MKVLYIQYMYTCIQSSISRREKLGVASTTTGINCRLYRSVLPEETDPPPKKKRESKTGKDEEEEKQETNKSKYRHLERERERERKRMQII